MKMKKKETILIETVTDKSNRIEFLFYFYMMYKSNSISRV